MAKSLISVDDVYNYTQQKTQKTKKKNKTNDKLDTISKITGLLPGAQGISMGAKILGNIDNSSDESWFKSGEGNLGKKTGASLIDALESITEGGLSSAEGISDYARQRGADVLDFFGATNKANSLREAAKENTTEEIMNLRRRIFQGDLSMSKTDEEVKQDDWITKSSILGEKSQGVLQGVGNSGANALMSGYLGGASVGLGETTRGILGLIPMYMSASGSGENEAIQSGATRSQARLYGILSGTIESGSEMMFGGLGKLSQTLGFSKGALDDAFINSLTSKLNNTLLKNGIDLGLRGVGEGFEEVAAGFFGAIAKKLTYMKDEDIKKLWEDEKLWDSFVSGALSSILMESPSHVSATVQGTESSTGITKNENKVIDAVVEERTQGQNLTKKEVNQVRNEVREDLQNGYISTETIEKVLGKEYDHSNDMYLQESYREQDRRRTAFNTDLEQYKNENQRAIVQKAIDSGILNNSKKTHDFVDLVSKLASDKGMDFDFTNNQRLQESGFSVKGKTINGLVDGNTIKVNIDSNNALNKTVGHEITHVLEGTDVYQELQNALKDYVGQETWNNRIKELSETYKNVENADVTKELTADLVGENLFNNEDFVRSLSTKNRNLFQKIFDEIKYLVKVATAGSKEKRELVKLQKVFQEAYRDSKTTKEGTQYSIKESKKALENQFKELTGDSMLVADAKLGNYAFQQIQGREVEAPYSKEAMDLYEKIQDSKQTSSHLYHSTPVDRIQSIVQNGLQVGSQQNQEGVSSTDKLYLSATEELADSFTPNDSVTLRISPNANLENLDNDLLGGEGSYTITNNIDPKYLQVKENGKWVNLLKSQYAKQNTKYSLSVEEANTTQDNEGRKLTDNQLAYFKDSKATDENGNLITVYHTTTGYNNQFNEFNPVGTPGYKYGNSIVNFYTESKEMSSSYGNNLISPNTTKIETMDDVNKLLGDRFRVEEKNGKYELYDKFEEKQIDNYKELIKLFSEEEQKMLNKTFNKSRGDLLNEFTNEEFEFYDKTRKKFLNMFYMYNTYTGIENNQVNRNFDEIIEDYLKNKKLSPYKTYNNQNELFRGITSATSPYEHYQYEGYLNLTNPYVIDAEGRNWNDIIKGENDTTKLMYESLTEQEKEEMTKLAKLTEDMYNNFEDQYLGFYQRLLSNNEELYDKVTKDNSIKEKLYTAAVNNWDENSIRDLIGKRNTTNDFVKQVLEMNKNGANYDGVIFNNITDYGANTLNKDTSIANNVYVTFNSNQFKAVDNLNPTDDADIRYQLGTNEIAPTQGWDVRGRDIALEQALAPVKEQINQLQEAIEELAPITEEEAVNLPVNENIEAPTRYNLTPEESNELDVLEQMDRAFGTEGEDLERLEELKTKEQQEDNLELTPVRGLEDIRDVDEVGKRDVNAYQYDHPEVKPFFQEEAERMLSDLNNTTKAERYTIPGTGKNINDYEWVGISRETSPEIAALLDGELGVKYSYDDIRKGLNAIIQDHGAENIAVAKRIEFLLDERLRKGYNVFGSYNPNDNYRPIHIEPNQEYINMLRGQEWSDIYEQIPVGEAPIEEPSIERPQEIAPTRQTADEMLLPIQQATRETEVKNRRQIEPRKKNSLRQAYETVVGGFVNRNVLIDDLSKRSKNTAIKFKGDMWSNYMGEGQSNISNYQTDINGNAIGEGVNTLFENAENAGIPSAVFNEFLIDYSNIDRWRNNKGSQTPYEESARRLRDYAIKYPQIKQYAQKVWKYGENSLQNRVDAGLMTQETADMLRKIYPHYVPYISQTEDLDNYYKKLNELKPLTIKRARGGAGALLPVQEALAQYTISEKKSIRQNELFNEIIDTIGEGDNFGIEKSDYTGMADSLFQDERGSYLTGYKDGKQRTAMIGNDLYNELARSNEQMVRNIEENLSIITKPIQKLSEIRRNLLTTWSPSFPVKNAIKDIQDALWNSKQTGKMIKNYPSAIVELKNMNTEQVRQFVSLYGSGMTQGEFFNDTINETSQNVKGLSWLKNLNEIIELAPRYAEFKASLENGASLQEAMYNAREITTNFGRGGTIAKAMNRNGFTFLNASIQGFDKFIRNFSGENGAKGIVSSLAKATAFGVLPALFNELAFGGGDDKDEEYEALPDYVKDNYYLIKMANGEFLRIPKGRMLSVFGSAARRTMEYAEGDKEAFNGFIQNAWNQTGVNNPTDNNMFAPLIQAFGSENGTAWYGGDIIPSRLQDEKPEDQYDASIDKLSIWLGQKTGISPYKINYVLDQYSGGMGDILLPQITEEATSSGGLLAPLRDQFVVDAVTDNKYVSDFYSTKDGLKGHEDETELKRKYLNSISSQMAELYKERREVQADTTLTKKEKYEKAQKIKNEINSLAKDGLETYEDLTIDGNYAEINGTSYQKGEDGQWKKVSSRTQDTVNELGLNTQEKQQYTSTKENINEIKQNYNNSDVKKDKILTEIINSKLSDDAKVELYKETYKDNTIDRYVDMGMKVDSYLDYKKQTFTADKDSNGKSISGSKKQKVFDYINSMNIPFEQKLILAKSEYPTYNEYNQEIIDYLNKNNNIDYNEMEKILLDLGFKVDEQGNISW